MLTLWPSLGCSLPAGGVCRLALRLGLSITSLISIVQKFWRPGGSPSQVRFFMAGALVVLTGLPEFLRPEPFSLPGTYARHQEE